MMGMGKIVLCVLAGVGWAGAAGEMTLQSSHVFRQPHVSVPAARWVMQETGTKASLRGLSVVDARVVWASGSGGTYLRTTDGNTWKAGKVKGAEELDFRGIKAFDATTAVVMSSGPAEQGRARIYRTRDAGESWTLAYETKTAGAFLDCMAFWDKQHGIAVGDPVGGKFFVIVTEDGGRSWTESHPSPKPGERVGHPGQTGERVGHPGEPMALEKDGAFAASNSCVAVEGKSNAWLVTGGASVARAFRSTDRGRTWEVATVPVKAAGASAGLFSVAFRDARHGVAVGGDYQQPTASETTVAVTDDGGRSWKPARTVAAGRFLSGVAWAGGQRLVAVGSAGWAQSSDGGQNWTLGGDEGFNVVAIGAGRVWAAGSAGRIETLDH